MSRIFEVGDLVEYTSGSHGHSNSNPRNTTGIISHVSDDNRHGDDNYHGIQVSWPGNLHNTYCPNDLTLVKDLKNEKQINIDDIKSVICTHPGPANITKGKEYEVVQVIKTITKNIFLYLINDDNMKMVKVYSHRFKVKQEPKPIEKTETKKPKNVKKTADKIKTQNTLQASGIINAIAGTTSDSSIWVHDGNFRNISTLSSEASIEATDRSRNEDSDLPW